MIFIIRLFSFIFAITLGMTAATAQTADKSAPSRSDEVIIQAWDILTEGCLRHADMLPEWVSQFPLLTPAQTDSAALPALGRTLGYPGEGATQAAWRLRDTQTLLLQQSQGGCTVAHDQFISFSKLGTLVTELARNIQAGTRTPTTIEKKSGTDGQFMFLIKSTAKDTRAKGSPHHYMLFVTSPNSSTGGVRTVMHSFRLSGDFKL